MFFLTFTETFMKFEKPILTTSALRFPIAMSANANSLYDIGFVCVYLEKKLENQRQFRSTNEKPFYKNPGQKMP